MRSWQMPARENETLVVADPRWRAGGSSGSRKCGDHTEAMNPCTESGGHDPTRVLKGSDVIVEQSMMYCVARQFDAVGHAQLVKDVVQVVLCSLDANG
jgi:hypothetical protein